MLIPVGNKVLIKIGKIEDKIGEIYLAPTLSDKEQLAKTRGTVIALGPLAYKEFGEGEPWVQVGDEVYFNKYGGLQHKEEQENGDIIDYRILMDQDIVAIIK